MFVVVVLWLLEIFNIDIYILSISMRKPRVQECSLMLAINLTLAAEIARHVSSYH